MIKFKELFTEAKFFGDPDDKISYADYGAAVDRFHKQAQERMGKIAKMAGIKTSDLGARELRRSNKTEDYIILAQGSDGSHIEISGNQTGSSNPVIFSYVSPRGTKLASIWMKNAKKTEDLTKDKFVDGLNQLKREMEFQDVEFKWPRNFNKFFK